MKKNSSSTKAGVALSALLVLSSILLLCVISLAGQNTKATRTKSARPSLPTAGPMPGSGTVNPTDTSPQTFVGTTISPGGVIDESECVDNVNCETYTLTIGGTPADWAGKKVQVLLTWQSGANEYDIYIHKGSNAGTLITSAIQ